METGKSDGSLRLDENGNPNYRFNPLLADLPAHVRMMDKAGIDVAVLSCGSGFDQPNLATCRLINDRMHQAEQDHPAASSDSRTSRRSIFGRQRPSLSVAALETQPRALFSIQSSASWRVSNQLMYRIRTRGGTARRADGEPHHPAGGETGGSQCAKQGGQAAVAASFCSDTRRARFSEGVGRHQTPRYNSIELRGRGCGAHAENCAIVAQPSPEYVALIRTAMRRCEAAKAAFAKSC